MHFIHSSAAHARPVRCWTWTFHSLAPDSCHAVLQRLLLEKEGWTLADLRHMLRWGPDKAARLKHHQRLKGLASAGSLRKTLGLHRLTALLPGQVCCLLEADPYGLMAGHWDKKMVFWLRCMGITHVQSGVLRLDRLQAGMPALSIRTLSVPFRALRMKKYLYWAS